MVRVVTEEAIPRGLLISRSLEKLLASVPPQYLAGIDTVVLRAGPANRRERLKRKSRPGRRLLGTYYRREGGHAAYIEIFADALPTNTGWVWHIAPLREALLGRVLFHEIGHHITRAIILERDSSEARAEKWGRELGRTFWRKHYWWVPVRFLARFWSKVRGEARNSTR